jgi:hypothetical protein
MPVKKKATQKKNPAKSNTIQKQIDETRNSAIALYNIMAKKGITNEKEFMSEYKAVTNFKKK